MKSLEERLESVKKDTLEVEDRNTTLQNKINKLQNEKQELDSQYEQKRQDQKDYLEPEIERIRQLIATRKQELAEGTESIDKQQADNKMLEEKLAGL